MVLAVLTRFNGTLQRQRLNHKGRKGTQRKKMCTMVLAVLTRLNRTAQRQKLSVSLCAQCLSGYTFVMLPEKLIQRLRDSRIRLVDLQQLANRWGYLRNRGVVIGISFFDPASKKQ